MSWEIEAFTSVVRDITGGNRKYLTSEYKLIGKYPIIDQGLGQIAGYTNENNIVKKNKPVVVFGDHTKIIKYVDFDFCLGADGVKVLETSDRLDPIFFYYYLGIQKLPDAGYSRHFKFLKEINIPLPSLPIQKQIAEILDKADALRKKDLELLKHYDALAQSLFIDMFGDPVKNEKGWEIDTLKNVSVKITDGTHFSPPNQSSGLPYITAKHVRKNFIDFYSNPTYISAKDHTSIYSRCNPKQGDVLYIKDGATTGIAAINNYDFEFSMLSSLALIKPNIAVLNSQYLCYWLNDENIKEDYIRTYMAGAAIRRFTLDKINKFSILIPPIDLQNQFAMQIQNIELQKEKVKAQIKASENLFQALLQKAFNGGL